jgi:hypothetical protein
MKGGGPEYLYEAAPPRRTRTCAKSFPSKTRGSRTGSTRPRTGRGNRLGKTESARADSRLRCRTDRSAMFDYLVRVTANMTHYVRVDVVAAACRALQVSPAQGFERAREESAPIPDPPHNAGSRPPKRKLPDVFWLNH